MGARTLFGRVRGVWAIVLFVVVVLAGCGGEADEEPPATTPARSGADIESGCWTEAQRAPGRPGLPLQWSVPPAMVVDPTTTYGATIETSRGTIELELDAAGSPASVNNVVCLARAGYYDGTAFHRIVPGFVIQGGDPSGTGSGGPGYQFPDEPVSRPYAPGDLAMANAGPDTNGSQFFIILDGGQGQLQPLYNLFGRVVGGQEVVEAIGGTDATTDPTAIERVTVSQG